MITTKLFCFCQFVSMHILHFLCDILFGVFAGVVIHFFCSFKTLEECFFPEVMLFSYVHRIKNHVYLCLSVFLCSSFSIPLSIWTMPIISLRLHGIHNEWRETREKKATCTREKHGQTFLPSLAIACYYCRYFYFMYVALYCVVRCSCCCCHFPLLEYWLHQTV